MDRRRGPRWRMILLLAGCCAALAAVAGEPASAAWSGRQLAVGDSASLPLFGVSCPSASLCVAVGGGNTIASSTRPAGGSDEWRAIYPGSGPAAPNQRQIRAVSCPSAQLCVAVTFEGLVYTSTNPSGGVGAWQMTDLAAVGPNLHLYGLSCPTASFCAASAGAAKVLTTTDPTGGAGAWHLTELEGPMELRGISCASAALCVAVGDDGDNIRPEVGDQAVVVASTAPLAGLWGKATLPGHGNLFGVACPSTGLCLSGDALGNLLVATNPVGGAAAWRRTDGGGSVQITDAECLSASLCLAIDNNGDVLASTDPTGGAAAWTFTNLVPYPGIEGGGPNHLFAASCPERDFCAASGSGGMIYTSDDPFAGDTGVAGPAGKKAKKGGKRPKRPRVTIAKAPPPGVEVPRGRRAKALYRFFARNRAQVRGFVCKLDDRPLRRCRSPKIYQVGLGRHVFRVRALGWSGLRGPAEVHRFRVCRPTPLGTCLGHVPPPR